MPLSRRRSHAQARTIRRLRALADGYRARVCHGCYRKQLLTAVVAAKQERARIVALLRAKVCANTSTNFRQRADSGGRMSRIPGLVWNSGTGIKAIGAERPAQGTISATRTGAQLPLPGTNR